MRRPAVAIIIAWCLRLIWGEMRRDEGKEGRRLETRIAKKQKQKTRNTTKGMYPSGRKDRRRRRMRQTTREISHATTPISKPPRHNPNIAIYRVIPSISRGRSHAAHYYSTQSLSRLRMSHNRVGQTPKSSRKEHPLPRPPVRPTNRTMSFP